MKTYLRDALIALVLVAVLFFAFQTVFQQNYVTQVSMYPNLQEGERIFVNKLVFHFREPHRGDIIVFRPVWPGNTVPLIKRVIGLPGETIKIESGTVYVNGAAIDEPYIKDPPRYQMSAVTVQAESYFVLGDNRNNSNDSHAGWTVPRDYIIGQAWLAVWPPGKWGLVPNYTYAD
jgi:signal peptidase I